MYVHSIFTIGVRLKLRLAEPRRNNSRLNGERAQPDAFDSVSRVKAGVFTDASVARTIMAMHIRSTHMFTLMYTERFVIGRRDRTSFGL